MMMTYHRYSTCLHGSCNKRSKYDVVGSSVAPLGETVSLCAKHFEDLNILDLTYEDEGNEEMESIKSDIGFYWKMEFLDEVLPDPPWIKARKK